MNTPEFRVSFPHLLQASLNKLSNKEEYSVLALFPKGADLSALKVAAEKAVIAKWGEDKLKWPANLRSPFRDQAEKAKNDNTGNMVLPAGHVEGAIFMNLKSKQKPHVVDKNVEDIIDASEIYAGCWGRASVNAYAYSHAGNNGVSFGLNNFQKTKEGEPLGGRTRAEHDFKAIESSDENNDGSANSIFA